MVNLGNALQELREERSGTQLRLEKLDQAISAIESLNGTGVSQKTHQSTRIVSAVNRQSNQPKFGLFSSVDYLYSRRAG
jgi:hypothetical protein